MIEAGIRLGPYEIQSPLGAGGWHIAPGDFVRIPAGVPHWISKIEGTEIVYLVVKAP